MAGSYPDVPGRRMAWDADGCVAVRRNITQGAAHVTIGSAARVELNDEDEVNVGIGGSPQTTVRVGIIFPELREIDGFFGRSNHTGSAGFTSDVEDSADTTNIEDGSWATAIASYSPGNTNVLNNGEYRNAITSLNRTGKRAIRLRVTSSTTNIGQLRAVHLYGEISPGQTPDRILFIDDDTGLEFDAPIDYGDVPRGSSEDYDIRLKNNSATLQANNIQYTAESLFLDSGAWYTFTEPGGSTFSATRQIGSLAADTTTGVIVVRRITPGAATLQLHAGRISADVDNWA